MQDVHNSPAVHAGAAVRTRSRTRFVILALLAVGTMINYLDRTVLGNAAPTMTKELGIDAAVMGSSSRRSHGPTRSPRYRAASSSIASAARSRTSSP